MKMCDCYSEPCKVCGKMISMHLGDFNTDRGEIFVVCEECIKDKWLGVHRFNYCVWDGKTEGKITIVALTKNAWQNRKYNHPNVSFTELLKTHKKERQKV